VLPLAGVILRASGLRVYLIRRWGKWFGQIGVRMALLILVSAVPMLVMAGDLALRAYDDRAAATLERATSARDEAVGRAEANLETVRQLLTTLSLSAPVLDPALAGCHDLMLQLKQIGGDPVISFGVVEGTGRIVCSSLRTEAELNSQPFYVTKRTWFQRVSQTHEFALGENQVGAMSGTQIIVAGLPVARGSAKGRIVYAGLRVSAFASPAELVSAWVLPPTGTMSVQGGENALPDPGRLAAVRASKARMSFTARGQDGMNYAYASAALTGNAHLLLAYPLQIRYARKLHAVLWRIAAMGALLLAEVTVVVVGAIYLVGRPLQLLRNEVRRYAPGRPFAPHGLELASSEVRELADAFAAATKRLAEHEMRQELLVREIHHRVKNNLQIVASLLNLQAARLRQPEARAEFQIARDRVQALATLHRHLTSQGEGSSIAMDEFLAELVRQMFGAMGEKIAGEMSEGEPEGGRIALVLDAGLLLPADQAVPVALIVTEAVSNALKYAFPDGASGTIRITLERGGAGLPDDAARLEVADDGVGWIDPEAGGDGIGMRLVKGFARQLGGQLSVCGVGGVSLVVDGIRASG